MRDKGDGSIYQLKGGDWMAQIIVGRYKNGRPKYKRARKPTKDEARDQLQDWLTTRKSTTKASARAIRADLRNITVGEYLDLFVKKLTPATDGRAHSTIDTYKQHIRDHMDRIRPLLLAELEPLHIRDMLWDLVLEDGLAPATVRLTKAALSQAMQEAILMGLMTSNPCRDAKAPPIRRDEIDPLEADEATKVLDGLFGDRFEASLTAGFTQGLRSGEILGLCWPQIDLDDGFMRIKWALKRRDKCYFLEPVKTEKSKRNLALPQRAVDAFKRRRLQQLEERAAAEYWEDAWVPNERGDGWRHAPGEEKAQPMHLVITGERNPGRPVNGGVLLTKVRRACRAAGVREVTAHMMRHGCASVLLGAGMELGELSNVLGHSSVAVTRDFYTHLQNPTRRKAAEAADEAFGTGKP